QLVDRGDCTLDLLSRHQELALWESVIGESQTTLLRPAAAAALASEAFGLCCAWSLDHATLGAGHIDTRIFARWARSFEDRLSGQDLIVHAQLADQVRRAIEDARLPLPETLRVAGIDNPPPNVNRLLAAISDRGVTVERLEPGQDRARCHRVTARDAEHEVHLAARWAAHTLAERPDARLAIVSSALGAERETITRVLTQTLTPNRYLYRGTSPPPFNLSLGEPLSELPMIDHALTTLRLLSGPQALGEIGKLLRSPFIGGHGHEAERRAQLDALLRRDGLPRLGMDRLLGRMQGFDAAAPAACPDLLGRLRQARANLPAPGQRLAPSAWAEHLRALLKALGWPGDRGLDSGEFQQYQRFIDLFEELSGLSKVRDRIGLAEAIRQLTRIAHDTVFQPQSPPSPLQVVGPLEAAGLQFDEIWLLGADERHWPAPPRPNPLLPAALQRELGMPHASAERELDFAVDLLDQLRGAAPLLIASHPTGADEQRVDPSPLITDWAPLDAPFLSDDGALPMITATAAPGPAEPMPASKGLRGPHRPAGGAALLAAQANCPFAAVAGYRLQARALDEPSTTPDPALLGTLVHRLLQRVWQDLETSSALHARSREALAETIGELAGQVLADAARRRPDLFTARFRLLERDRLVALTLDWLDLERQRQRPFAVLALERDQTIRISGIELQTRADRIDRLEDGSAVVIDYKTGRELTDAGWYEDRVTEPQLPLYALAAGPEVAASLLARVRSDGSGCRFVGISRQPDFGAGVPALEARAEGLGWDDLIAHWRTSLGALAAEFAAGRADPTPSPAACRYCDFAGLCRVGERTPGDDDG
ncbi:MAG: PD-(D/E)XK nuclease family protein, partial [Chromatiaceae bacterium]